MNVNEKIKALRDKKQGIKFDASTSNNHKIRHNNKNVKQFNKAARHK